MGIIGPLKRKQGLAPSFTDDSGERSIPECTKVDRLLELNAMVTKRDIEPITSLLTMETLHLEGI